MGGNTKIAIEMTRILPQMGWRVVVIIPAGKQATFSDNVPRTDAVSYFQIADFKGNEFCSPVSSSLHFRRELKTAFSALSVGVGDVVFVTCNFHIDILPIYGLKRRLGFTYLPSHFLFIPFVFENLRRHYRFPVLKYLIGWFYERFLFALAKRQADGFVITNDSDLVHFRESMRPQIFSFYGGVNLEQIPKGVEPKTRNIVFCSRLHPQKGIEGLLEIWAMVVARLPNARLSVIGNGEPRYEDRLRRKAVRLRIEGNVEWIGYLNNEAKYAVYQSAKALAHSTVYDNNGMVAAEALCSGLPVVMYDLPALRKVYADGCVKVPYGDQRAYADALVRLMSDEEWRKSVAPDAGQIEKLRKFWGWESRVGCFAAFLDSLLKQRREERHG